MKPDIKALRANALRMEMLYQQTVRTISYCSDALRSAKHAANHAVELRDAARAALAKAERSKER